MRKEAKQLWQNVPPVLWCSFEHNPGVIMICMAQLLFFTIRYWFLGWYRLAMKGVG